MKYYKVIENGYIVQIGTGDFATEIAESEYNELLSIIQTVPKASDGYQYKLRADNLEWELVELPDPEPIEEEATAEDYEQALQQMGVDFNDEN